jgi:hypothetical protein
MTTNSISAPATHVALTTEKTLLIVLKPDSHKSWWIDRKGILSLNHKGIIIWHSDHNISEKPFGEQMTDLISGFKPLGKEGWTVWLSEHGNTWGEWGFGECEYFSNKVLIPIYPATFALGGRN